jgi:hypothetical protein
MKGYGVASWLKKEEYKNYFVSANSIQNPEGPYLRLNRLNEANKKEFHQIGKVALSNYCKCISVGNYNGNMGIAATGMEDGSVMLWDIDTLYKEGDTVADNSHSSA